MDVCAGLFTGLGLLDKLLAPLILIFMIVGTAVGATTGDAIPNAFNQVQFKGVSFRTSAHCSVWTRRAGLT